MALDGADPEARSCLGMALIMRGDHRGALTEAERALAATPNLADAHGTRGVALIYSERPAEGVTAIEMNVRLDPCDPLLAFRLSQLAIGRYFCGEYDGAIEVATRGIQSYPDYPLTYRWLAAALAQAGRIEEAKETLATAIAIAPASFDVYVRARPPWMQPEDHAHMVEGLRKAGWKS